MDKYMHTSPFFTSIITIYIIYINILHFYCFFCIIYVFENINTNIFS